MNFLKLRISNMNKIIFDAINFIILPKVNAQQTEVKLVVGFSSIAIHYLLTLKYLKVTFQRKI